MKIILDANVLIAAFATHGICNDLYELCIENHDVFISEHLLDEIQAGFIKKVKMSKESAGQNLEYVKSNSTLGIPQMVPSNSCRDPKDLPILGLALASRADYIISGDEDLLVLKKFKKTVILSPRGFWEVTRKNKGGISRKGHKTV